MKPRPLEATVIGSWSFPGWFEAWIAQAAAHPERFGRGDREEALDDAVRIAVSDQVEAGLDRVTDGEMQRVDFNLGFYDYLEGIKPLPCERLWGAPGHDQRSRYVARSTIHAPRGLGTLEELARLRKWYTGPIKVPVPGPYTLAGCIRGGDVYRDRAQVTEALVPVVNAELKGLVRAGVEFIQLDEPSFACHPDQPDVFVDVVNRTVEGVECYISMHMCFGNYRARAVAHRSYRGVIEHAARTRVHQLALEFASREMSEVELLDKLSEDMDVAVGLIDVKNTWIEPPELVVERLGLVLRHVAPERVSITPDCGFSQTPRQVARVKAAALAEGARRVRRARGLE